MKTPDIFKGWQTTDKVSPDDLQRVLIELYVMHMQKSVDPNAEVDSNITFPLAIFDMIASQIVGPEEWVKQKAAWEKKRDDYNKARSEQAAKDAAIIQALADELFVKGQAHSALSAATIIAATRGGNVDTLRKKIKPPIK